ncbi:MAG: ornithine cyclodeaminase family protein [Gemmatimonadota bacterium]
MLLISQSEVPALLPMHECMTVMADALAMLARGDAVQPLRHMLRVPDRAGILAMMPGYVGSKESLGIKVITVFQANHGTEFDSHQGVVLLFEAEHGSLVAIIDASSITAIRTAAVSGVATRLLARSDATDLCIMGSGVQARTHLDAMLLARPISRVRVWSRNSENGLAFARASAERHNIAVEAIASAREAVSGASIICVTTSSREPVLCGEWVADGAHINAVGSSVPSAREVDTALVHRARLFVDRRESTVNEAGDFLIPKSEGVIGDDHIVGEIGDILIERCAARGASSEVTLFKSLGLAIEDVAAAQHVYMRALAAGVGTSIALGGRR